MTIGEVDSIIPTNRLPTFNSQPDMMHLQTFPKPFETRSGHAFLDDGFLLSSPTAERLYENFARHQPIVDYHNHLDPVSLGENRRYDNIAELWIAHDPYKHRAMRINGIPERYITGDAPLKEKFLAWARTLPQCVGNPLFHWSHLELKTVFGVDTILTEETAESVWNDCNRQLREQESGERDFLRFWNVETACTSDDLLDDLSPHALATDNSLTIVPSLRGDSILQSSGRDEWFKRLEMSFGNPIQTLDDFFDALRKQLDLFDVAGCRLADHSLDDGFRFNMPSNRAADELFQWYLSGIEGMNRKALSQWQSFLLVFLAQEYAKRGWTMQLHLGALRRTSSRLRRLTGCAGGYACIGSGIHAESIVRFLDVLEERESLPRMILYTLNPSDNPILATLTGSFAEDGVPGKIQFGPAWWYNDFSDEIRRHLTALAGYSLLGRFVGMTTDSRSVFSFSRHDYFRRILCSQIGEWVRSGEAPDDDALLGPLVENICVKNARILFVDNQNLSVKHES